MEKMIKHPTKPIAVHTWDWKTQPDWDSISEVVTEFQEQFKNGVSIKFIETRSDENAIVISDKDLTESQANAAYQNHYDWEDGLDPETLDWGFIKTYLDEIRMQYTSIGAAGIPALNAVINPLLLRYEKGERTADLHESIMDLK